MDYQERGSNIQAGEHQLKMLDAAKPPPALGQYQHIYNPDPERAWSEHSSESSGLSEGEAESPEAQAQLQKVLPPLAVVYTPQNLPPKPVSHMRKSSTATAAGKIRGKYRKGRPQAGSAPLKKKRAPPKVRTSDDEWDDTADVVCGQCNMEFKTISGLELHMQLHIKECVFDPNRGDSHVPTRGNRGEKLQPAPNDVGWKLVGDRYECPVCHRTLSRSHGDLNAHMRLHTGEKPFPCEVCGRMFRVKSQLTSHMKIHTGEKPFSCTVCGKAFAHGNSLKLHMASHTGERPYACEICQKRFVTLGHLKSHYNVHADKSIVRPKTHRCEICGKMFAQKNYLRQHRKIHSGIKPFACEICGKAFLCRAELVRHSVVHTGEKPYVCDLCPSRYSSRGALAMHRKKHGGGSQYVCEICNAAFALPRDLQRHNIVHTGEKPYGCETCGEKFAARKKLKEHMKLHSGEHAYVCKVCNKTFASASNLDKHIPLHEGANSASQPFVCSVCSRSFAGEGGLNKHMRVHLETQMAASTVTNTMRMGHQIHMCNQCGKALPSAQSLAEHMRSHERFRCDICDAGFSSAVFLNRHMETHTFSPPTASAFAPSPVAPQSGDTQCPICSKLMPDNVALSTHMLSHSGLKSMHCEYCGPGVAFLSRNDYHMHMMMHAQQKQFPFPRP